MRKNNSEMTFFFLLAIQNIKKNISKYAEEFKKEDAEREKQEEEARRQKRQVLKLKFRTYLAEKMKELEKDRDIRRQLLGGEDESDNSEWRDVWKEEIEEEITEIVQK